MLADKYGRFDWTAFKKMSFTKLQIACSVLEENTIVLLPRCICGIKSDGSRMFVIHAEKHAYDSDEWRRTVLRCVYDDVEFASTSFERVVAPSDDGRSYVVHEDQTASIALRSESAASKSVNYYMGFCECSVHRSLCRHLVAILEHNSISVKTWSGDAVPQTVD